MPHTVLRETSETPTRMSLTGGSVIPVLQLIKEMCITPSHLATATVLVKGKLTLIFFERTSNNLPATVSVL